MRTLVVSPFSPYPLVFGGAIRLYNVMRALRTFSDIELVGFESWAEDQSEVRQHLASLCTRATLVPREHASDTAGRARSLLTRSSFQQLDHRSSRLQQAIDDALAERPADCVFVEMTPMAQYRVDTGAFKVLDLQNIEHELAQRRASHAGWGPRRAGMELEWRKVRREELAALSRFDLVFAPSDRERDLLAASVRNPGVVGTLPNTIDADSFDPTLRHPDADQITFVGATHVDANRDGVVWFAREVLPLVRERRPAARLSVVGGDPPADVRALGRLEGIEVLGYVPDTRPHLARAAVVVVPLRSGGGTRLKILESLAAGAPTVSTSVGAEGLGLEPEREILLADDAAGFAAAVVRVLDDQDLQRTLGELGRQVVEKRYSWQALVPILEGCIRGATPS